MQVNRIATWLAAGAMLAALPAFPQSETHEGQGQAVVTILPLHDGQAPASVSQKNLSLKVNGKDSNITRWVPLRGNDGSLELVLLIDGAARTSLGTQMSEIARFVQSLPPDAKVAIAYMENGRAVMGAPFSADHAAVLRGLHLPGGVPGISASPYFCLSDLAKNWPSQNRQARREVVMITDGVDYYEMRYDPEDPYVQTAIRDSARAGIVVYSIYWRNQGRADRSMYENNAGQSLLLEVTQSTGGNSYWEGMGNPVTFRPYFDDLNQRLQNQYEISFDSHLGGKPEVENMKLKVTGVAAKVDAPQQVFVGHVAVGDGD